MLRLILVFCTFFCAKMLFSQNGKLVGKVRDVKGGAIIGASVIYRKDITIGATTDEQGNYLMELPVGKFSIFSLVFPWPYGSLINIVFWGMPIAQSIWVISLCNLQKGKWNTKCFSCK